MSAVIRPIGALIFTSASPSETGTLNTRWRDLGHACGALVPQEMPQTGVIMSRLSEDSVRPVCPVCTHES